MKPRELADHPAPAPAPGLGSRSEGEGRESTPAIEAPARRAQGVRAVAPGLKTCGFTSARGDRLSRVKTALNFLTVEPEVEHVGGEEGTLQADAFLRHFIRSTRHLRGLPAAPPSPWRPLSLTENLLRWPGRSLPAHEAPNPSLRRPRVSSSGLR